MDASITPPKPTPKPRLSKGAGVVNNTKPPPPAIVLESFSNEIQEEKNGFDLKLDSFDDETSEVLNHFEFLDRPDSLGNGIDSSTAIPTEGNYEKNSKPLDEKCDKLNAVENPEYVSFPYIRPEKPLNQSKNRSSDLMWFTSGVPQEFMSKDKSPSNGDTKTTQRLYPDLDAFLFNENAELAHRDSIPSNSTSADHSLQSPVRDNVPKRQSIRRYL